MLLWAGLLHDVGKAQIPVTLLEKITGFSSADREAMEPHVEFGWKLLQEVHDHTAHIIVRHHRHGKRPYPETLPPLPEYLQPRRDIVEDASRLLALADYYDALMTRQNDRNGGEGLSKEARRDLYLRENPGFEPLIQKLEAVGVFTF
jgi:response regulator RpfG family c-di-GMP phosphodiesterase